MKKLVLFTINLDVASDLDPKLAEFVDDVSWLIGTPEKSKLKSKYTRKLSSSAFLIDVERDLPFLGQLSSLCEKRKNLVSSCDVLLLDTDREWTTYPMNKQ